MEEDDILDGALPKPEADDSSPKLPAWARPAHRDDTIGRLAWQVRGRKDTDAPDLTAAPLLVEAVREASGDQAADALAREFMVLLKSFPVQFIAEVEKNSEQDRRPTVRMIRECVGRIVAAYLFDLTSACGVMARVLELCGKPPTPLEQAKAELDVTFITLPGHYSRGDRVSLPDGRRAVVVTDRRADGKYGVVPADNSEPTAMVEGGMMATDSDEMYGNTWQ